MNFCLVSTIIPVRNRPDMLIRAVESVLAQSYRPIEIIIVDDGSTDNTPEVASSLASQHPTEVRLLQQANAGPGPARETGRLASQGEFIQYLDSDDRLLPNKFADQVKALREHPDCGVAYGMTRLIDANGSILAEPYKWTGQRHERLFPALLVDRWWCTHSPLYRRSVCDEVGPWSNLRYSQDWEYDARVAASGTRLFFTGTYVSEHGHHSGHRQTGEGRWLDFDGQVHFFKALLSSARKAGIEQGSKELNHFARWVFSGARMAGAAGETTAAQLLFELAVDAAGQMDLGMRGAAFLSRSLGWYVTGSLAELASRLPFRNPGSQTLPQSWVESRGRWS